jgi:hypothetical protein
MNENIKTAQMTPEELNEFVLNESENIKNGKFYRANKCLEVLIRLEAERIQNKECKCSNKED